MLGDLNDRDKIIRNLASGGEWSSLKLRTRKYSQLGNTNSVAFHKHAFVALTHSLRTDCARSRAVAPSRAMCCPVYSQPQASIYLTFNFGVSFMSPPPRLVFRLKSKGPKVSISMRRAAATSRITIYGHTDYFFCTVCTVRPSNSNPPNVHTPTLYAMVFRKLRCIGRRRRDF